MTTRRGRAAWPRRPSRPSRRPFKRAGRAAEQLDVRRRKGSRARARRPAAARAATASRRGGPGRGPHGRASRMGAATLAPTRRVPRRRLARAFKRRHLPPSRERARASRRVQSQVRRRAQRRAAARAQAGSSPSHGGAPSSIRRMRRRPRRRRPPTAPLLMQQRTPPPSLPTAVPRPPPRRQLRASWPRRAAGPPTGPPRPGRVWRRRAGAHGWSSTRRGRLGRDARPSSRDGRGEASAPLLNRRELYTHLGLAPQSALGAACRVDVDGDEFGELRGRRSTRTAYLNCGHVPFRSTPCY